MAQRARGRKRAAQAATPPAGPAPARYEASVSARSLPRGLLCVALALLACHAGLTLYHYRVEELSWLLLQFFDVNQENNLPTWFSQFLLLTASS